MLYLTTGANGVGKTLLTLKDVREKSLKEGRPVAWNGRFKLDPIKEAEWGWRRIDAKDWQAEPDGTIFLIDECHNDFPVRANGAPVPEYVRMLAEHRARGFDFFLMTQHPMNIDAFIRKIIGNPGWHRHIKRQAGAPLVSVLQWDSVKTDCEKAGSGASGQVSMVAFPKEVYGWYESATLHTAKVKIPTQAKVLLACLCLFPLIGYYAYNAVIKANPALNKAVPPVAAAGAMKSPPLATNSPGQTGPKTSAEYAQSFVPRIPGLQYTAPRYDTATTVAVVPYPAACVSMGDRCSCFTQQATSLDVPKPLCLQIVKGGFFADWQGALQDTKAGRVPLARPAPLAAL